MGIQESDDKVPVVRILFGVHEALAFDQRCEEEDREDDGVHGIGEQVE